MLKDHGNVAEKYVAGLYFKKMSAKRKYYKHTQNYALAGFLDDEPK